MFTIRIGSTFGILHEHSPKEKKDILDKRKVKGLKTKKVAKLNKKKKK